MGFGVWGLGFGVWGLRLISGLGFVYKGSLCGIGQLLKAGTPTKGTRKGPLGDQQLPLERLEPCRGLPHAHCGWNEKNRHSKASPRALYDAWSSGRA